MHKPTVQRIHKQHHVFGDEIKISIIHQYSNTIKQWKFFGFRCMHCENTFKTAVTVMKHKGICKELNTTKKVKEQEMPIQVITIKGERYYRYGDSGKPYKNRADAEKQAQAIHASGYKEPKKDMKEKK
jgi:hypothetical protein